MLFVHVGFCGPDCGVFGVVLVNIISGVNGMNEVTHGFLWWFSITVSVFSSGWLGDRGVVFSSMLTCVGLPVGVQVAIDVFSVSGGSVGGGVVSVRVVFICVVRGFSCGCVGLFFLGRVASQMGKDGSMILVRAARVASSVSSFMWGVCCLTLLVATRSALSQSTTSSDFIIVMVSSSKRK